MESGAVRAASTTGGSVRSPLPRMALPSNSPVTAQGAVDRRSARAPDGALDRSSSVTGTGDRRSKSSMDPERTDAAIAAICRGAYEVGHGPRCQPTARYANAGEFWTALENQSARFERSRRRSTTRATRTCAVGGLVSSQPPPTGRDRSAWPRRGALWLALGTVFGCWAERAAFVGEQQNAECSTAQSSIRAQCCSALRRSSAARGHGARIPAGQFYQG
jgi:hypothetical protein